MVGVIFGEALTVTWSFNKNIGGRVECQQNEEIITVVEVRNNIHYKIKELPMDVRGSPMLAGDPSCATPASVTNIPYETRNFYQF
jgi:hypothetical protein